MDLQQLKTFVLVVHHGSFAEAARRLNVAPSMVSRAVAALEAELGVRLLQRSTRQLALTEAGAAYHAQVAGLVDGLDQAADEARAAIGQVRGTVRMTTTVSYGQTLVVPLLGELHARHPELELDLRLSDTVEDLLAERIDLAIRLGPPADSGLVGTRLADIGYRVCASPDYLQRHGRPRTPADLAVCDCLRFPMPGFRTQWKFRDAAGRVQAVDVKGWLVASSAMALHRAALDGLGPALLSHWLVDADLAAGRLVDLFPDRDATAGQFDSAAWLLYPSRAHLPLRVRAVIDFFRQRLSEAPRAARARTAPLSGRAAAPALRARRSARRPAR